MGNDTHGHLIGRAFRIAMLAAVLALPTLAAAQERIREIRLGRHAGYARIVLDVTGGDAYVTSDPAELYVDAEPPTLDSTLRGDLEALGVRLERSGAGTRLILGLEAARAWTAFRLGSQSPRIVLDVGFDAPRIPRGAQRLPERPSRSARVPRPVAAPPTDRMERDPLGQASESASEQELRVRASGITFVGLGPDGPTRAELLDLPLVVRLAPGGDWEAASGSDDAQELTLGELTASASGEPALTDTVLQQVVERIAAAYTRRGQMGTRIDIREADLEPLLVKSGRLVVHITEPDTSRP